MPTTKQRRQNARRRLQRQLDRRREAARKRRQRNALAAVVATVVAVVAVGLTVFIVGGGGDDGTTQAAAPTATPSSTPIPSRMPPAKAKRSPKATSGPCKYAETQSTLDSPYTFDMGLPPDPANTPATGTVPVTLKTNAGNIVITLDRAEAPCAVQSFVYLADKGFYENSACHRLTTQGIFVVQCGDPTTSGSGGPTYQFKDEHLTTAAYGDAIVAMANGGPNTNGSQFFIIYKDSNGGLQKNYSVIGSVTSGMDAVQKIAAAGADDSNGPGDGHPNSDLIIQGITRKQ